MKSETPVLVSFDQEQAERHIAALGIPLDQAIIQSVIPRCVPIPPGYKKHPDTKHFAYDPKEIERLAGKANLYVVANLGGRLDKDITACTNTRAEYDDGRPVEEQVHTWEDKGFLEPSIQLWTGGKSVHDIFRLDPVAAPEDWRPIQVRQTAHLGGDPHMDSPCQPMRLAGTPYVDKKTGKPNGNLAVLLSVTDATYTLEEIVAALPEEPKTAKEQPAGRPARELARTPVKKAEFINDYTVEEVREWFFQGPVFVSSEKGGTTDCERDEAKRFVAGAIDLLRRMNEDPEVVKDWTRERMPDWVGGPEWVRDVIEKGNGRIKKNSFFAILKERGVKARTQTPTEIDYQPNYAPPKGNRVGKPLMPNTHFNLVEVVNHYQNTYRNLGVKSEDKVAALAFQTINFAKSIEFVYGKKGRRPVSVNFTPKAEVIKWAGKLGIAIDPTDERQIKTIRNRLKLIREGSIASGALAAVGETGLVPSDGTIAADAAAPTVLPEVPRESRTVLEEVPGTSETVLLEVPGHRSKGDQIDCAAVDPEDDPDLTRTYLGRTDLGRTKPGVDSASSAEPRQEENRSVTDLLPMPTDQSQNPNGQSQNQNSQEKKEQPPGGFGWVVPGVGDRVLVDGVAADWIVKAVFPEQALAKVEAWDGTTRYRDLRCLQLAAT